MKYNLILLNGAALLNYISFLSSFCLKFSATVCQLSSRWFSSSECLAPRWPGFLTIYLAPRWPGFLANYLAPRSTP